MARLFDNAANEYLAIGNAVLSAYPITMACWANVDDDTGSVSLIGIGDSSVGNHYHVLRLRGNLGNRVDAHSIDGVSGVANIAAGYVVDTWHHFCGVFSASNLRAVFVDGGSKATNATDVSPAGLDRTTIGASPDQFLAFKMSGRIAEAAIWNAALSDAEVAILAAGYSPLFVRPQNLVAYWPLVRDEDQDRVGGYDMTAFNAPTIGPHPPIIYPASRTFYSLAAAPVGLSIPVAMRHYRNLRM